MSSEHPSLSWLRPGMLIPLAWLVVSTCRPRPDPGDITRQADYLAGSPTEGIVLALLILGACIILAHRRDLAGEAFRRNLPLVALFAFAAVSITWSAFPVVALKRWLRFFGSFLAVLVVVTEPDPLRATRRVLFAYLIAILSASLVAIHLFPEAGTMPFGGSGRTAWVGVVGDKNGLGQVAAVAVLYATWVLMFVRPVDRRAAHIILLLAGAYLLLGSDSVTSIFVTTIGLGALVLLYSARSRIDAGFVAFALGGAVAATLLLLASETVFMRPPQDVVLGQFGRNATLTARVPLWEDLLKIGARHPVLGVGYGSFWLGDRGHDLWAKYVWRPNQGHNGYIDVYVELGLAGLMLLSVVVASALFHSLASFREMPKYAALRLAILAAILTANITESSLCRLNDKLWFLFLLVSAVPPSPDAVAAHPGGQLVHAS